jgi:hypothetical protein
MHDIGRPAPGAALLGLLATALTGCGRSFLTVPRFDAVAAEPSTCPECSEHASCERGADTLSCTCRDGFLGDGHTCLDIDECAQASSGCDRQHGVCTNTEGGYACSCAGGWWLARDGQTCVASITASQVATGKLNTCAVKLDGTIACWGLEVR